MLPIRDNVHSRRKPWVTYTLIIVNVAIFLLQWMQPNFMVNQQQRLYGFTPAYYFGISSQSLAVSSWLTLFTSQFLHGGWSHIIGNMLYLWVFGDNIEDELGHLPFLGFYLGSGAFGALMYGIFNMQSYTPLIGASGAIAGVLGAYFILFPRARIRSLVPLFIIFFTINVPAVFFLGAWFLLQVVNSSFASGASTVAYAAHVGGFIVGVLVGLWLKRRRHNRWELISPGEIVPDDSIPLQ